MPEALPLTATGRNRLCRRPCAIISLAAAVLLLCSSATTAQPGGPAMDARGPIQGRPAPSRPAALEAPGVSELLTGGPDAWTSPEGLGSTLKVMLLLTVLSLAPAVLLMTTSFVRIVIVLSLLRQALGTQH
ncbi:MAG: hypothetical protein WD403_16755, partial [Pirellulales bacterium]